MKTETEPTTQEMLKGVSVTLGVGFAGSLILGVAFLYIRFDWIGGTSSIGSSGLISALVAFSIPFFLGRAIGSYSSKENLLRFDSAERKQRRLYMVVPFRGGQAAVVPKDGLRSRIERNQKVTLALVICSFIAFFFLESSVESSHGRLSGLGYSTYAICQVVAFLTAILRGSTNVLSEFFLSKKPVILSRGDTSFVCAKSSEFVYVCPSSDLERFSLATAQDEYRTYRGTPVQ